MKQFNNLSNAIGRLTLNSPGLPLGPTRIGSGAHSSFDEFMSSNNKNKVCPVGFGIKSGLFCCFF